MSHYTIKSPGLLLFLLFAILSVALISCGDSQSVPTLNSHLDTFSEMIEEYKTTVGSDQSKQAEWDEKMDAMATKWTDMRNELGSDITPQKMDKLVKQYEDLMATLNNFKKTIGS